MTTIIKVPSVYTCKIPSGEWLNLALVRRLQHDDIDGTPLVIITWENGDKNRFTGPDAKAILTAWEEAHKIAQQRLQEFA
jgi:hypothetical protein